MSKESKKSKSAASTPAPAHEKSPEKSSKSKEKSNKSSKSAEKPSEKHVEKADKHEKEKHVDKSEKHVEKRIERPEKHVESKDEAKKPRKKRTTKDPNRPKRPLSGYLLFCNAHRENVKKEHPDFKATEVTAHLGHMWKELTERDKQVPFLNVEN
jgi:hypothetical protein